MPKCLRHRPTCWSLASGAVLAMLAAPIARADSPLTSIDLAAAYPDLEAVAQAGQSHRVEGEVLRFLLSDAPTDQKAAVVCALGWQFEGQHNAARFLDGLSAARARQVEQLQLSDLGPAEQFVLGYLLAMDTYLKLRPLVPRAQGIRGMSPLALLDAATAALPDDFAVHYVRALVQAQAAMDKSWCQVFRLPQAVLTRFPPGRRNLRPEAVAAAQAYLSGYEKECPGTPAAKAVQLAELNQVYALGMLDGQLVAGTQAGVVVWDPNRPDPVAIHKAFICQPVVIWHAAAWLGCDREVVRWDGKSFRKYLPRKAQDGVYHQTMLGPDGALWDRYGKRTFAFDPARDTFRPIKTPWRGSPYSVLFTRDGRLWWIEFLRAIHTPERRYDLKSEDYPGRDPRKLREDSLGHLWVEDFESGLFRFDPASGRFIRQPGLERQATGVAFDLSREWIWMLEYRRGLTVLSNSRLAKTIDLSDLEYMRDLLVTDSGEVWVAGWNQIVRLTPNGESFDRTAYVVR